MNLSQYRSVVNLPAIKDSDELHVFIRTDEGGFFIYEDSTFGRRVVIDHCNDATLEANDTIDVGSWDVYLNEVLAPIVERSHAWIYTHIVYSAGGTACIWRRGDEAALHNLLGYFEGCLVSDMVIDAVNGPSCTKDWLMLRVIEEDNSYKPYVYGFDDLSVAVRCSGSSVRELKKLGNISWAEIVLD